MTIFVSFSLVKTQYETISKCQSKENNIWSAITDIDREGHFVSHKKKNISYNVFDLGKS